MSLDPNLVKACCAAGYSSDLVSLLLGDSYHPGGLTLTRHLLDLMGCYPEHTVLDVAAGRGTTALAVAAEYGASVDGIDLSPANMRLAADAAAASGLSSRARFHHGDAEQLPLPDASWDRVLCECALCTFPDKKAATSEIARVLRPGGRAGITDVTADPDRLPAELTSVAAWVACIADARPVVEYLDLLTGAGLQILTVEDHHSALERMINQVAARLDLLRLTARAGLDELGLDLARAQPVLAAARQAIADRVLSYTLIVAQKPCD